MSSARAYFASDDFESTFYSGICSDLGFVHVHAFQRLFGQSYSEWERKEIVRFGWLQNCKSAHVVSVLVKSTWYRNANEVDTEKVIRFCESVFSDEQKRIEVVQNLGDRLQKVEKFGVFIVKDVGFVAKRVPVRDGYWRIYVMLKIVRWNIYVSFIQRGIPTTIQRYRVSPSIRLCCRYILDSRALVWLENCHPSRFQLCKRIGGTNFSRVLITRTSLTILVVQNPLN